MLNIRKVLAATAVSVVMTAQMVSPALAITSTPTKQSVPTVAKSVAIKEKVVVVSLSHTTVRASRSSARQMISSEYAQYFDAEALTFMTVYSKGWSMHQWKCLRKLWTAESHFNPKADNKYSSAFGVAQRLGETSLDVRVQIRTGLKYIDKRYGSACAAWDHHKRKGWY